jgi:hypothetical protein
MRNQPNCLLAAVFVIFLFPLAAAFGAEPPAGFASQSSSGEATPVWTPLVSNDDARNSQSNNEVWIDGRWFWDEESCDLVWFPGCLDLPIIGDTCEDSRQAYYPQPDCGYFNMTFAYDFFVSGGSPIAVQWLPPTAERVMVREELSRYAASVAASPTSHLLPAPAVRATPWYHFEGQMTFFSKIGTHTETISRTIANEVKSAAAISGKHLSFVATKAAAIGAHAAVFGAHAAIITGHVAALVAVHALKK